MRKAIYLELPPAPGEDLVPLLNDRMRRLAHRLAEHATAIENASALVSCTHLERQQSHPAAAYPEDTLLWEIDRGPIWVVQLVGRTHIWKYLTGIAQWPYADRFTDLGVYDAGLPFRASDWKVSWRWSGIAWLYMAGVYENTFANRPAGLGTSDAGLPFRATDWNVTWRWSGSAWEYREGVHEGTLANLPEGLGAGDAGLLYRITTGTDAIQYYHVVKWHGAGWEAADKFGCYWQDYGRPPVDPGWQLSDGTETKYLWITDGELEEVAIVVPDLTAGALRIGGGNYTGETSATGSTGSDIALPANHNLVPQSEIFDDWQKELIFPNISVLADQIENPVNSEVTADRVNYNSTGPHYLCKGFYSSKGQQVTFSVWLRAVAGTFTLKISIFDMATGGMWFNGVSSAEIELSETWQKYSVAYTPNASGPVYLKAAVGGCYGPNPEQWDLPATGSIYIFGAQVGMGDPEYVPTGARPVIGDWSPPEEESPGSVPSNLASDVLTVLPYFRR